MKQLGKKRDLALGIALLALGLLKPMPSLSQGENTPIKLAVSLQATSVPEYFPISFAISVTNSGANQISICPYAVGRVSGRVPYVKIEGPLATPPRQLIGGSIQIDRETLEPGSTILLQGYVQDYVRHLRPGTYNIPYSVIWACPNDVNGKLSARGQFAFTVTSADSAALQRYISEQVADLKRTVEFPKAMDLARAIALVDSPEVVPALGTLVQQGFIAEAVDASTRLPDRDAVKVLTDVAASSNDPQVVSDALTGLEERHGSLPLNVIRLLLGSQSKWLRIVGIEYVGRNKRTEFLHEIQSLSGSNEIDVRQAAEKTMYELQTPK